jgi:hypothetical protein
MKIATCWYEDGWIMGVVSFTFMLNLLKDLALEYVPLAQLYDDAEIELEQYPDWGLEDVVIIKLLAWFKNFFSWVDQPACQFCSVRPTFLSFGEAG